MSPAATPEAEQADLIRRMARTLIADAAEHGADLSDAAVRSGFTAGLAVALGWIVSARETGQADISDEAFQVLEDMLGAAVVSLRPESDSGH